MVRSSCAETGRPCRGRGVDPCEHTGNEEAYARGDRPVPASIGMVVDYSWFACLVITGPFLPTYYELQITYKLHPQETK